MKKLFLSDLLTVVSVNKVIGNAKEASFSFAKSLNDATDDSIIWIKPTVVEKEKLISETSAKFIICDSSVDERFLQGINKNVFLVDNPKLEFIRVLKAFFVESVLWGIHETAVVHPMAVIHEKVHIGPNSVIGKCNIGEGSIIHGNCYIYDNVSIGRFVKINANTVIGSEGFGYSRNNSGVFEFFPHIGGVIIEDNVDIGSNTSIDRGSLGNTIVKEGAKIDNLVHIAHNVVVGKHSAVIANAMLGGSIEIGEYSWIAPSASIMDQLRIGSKSTVGMGAVVTKNIPDGKIWTGIPARPLDDFIRLQEKLKNL